MFISLCIYALAMQLAANSLKLFSLFFELMRRADSAGMWFDDLWWDLRVSRNVVVSQSASDWAGNPSCSVSPLCTESTEMHTIIDLSVLCQYNNVFRSNRRCIKSWLVGAGIMLEVSTGPALIDNNVIFTTGGQGGIFESDSNNATIVHNLVMNPVGAALYLSGTGGGRHYNCRQVDGEGVRRNSVEGFHQFKAIEATVCLASTHLWTIEHLLFG